MSASATCSRFSSSIPPYWETARKFFNEHVGDPNNPEDVERLKTTVSALLGGQDQGPAARRPGRQRSALQGPRVEADRHRDARPRPRCRVSTSPTTRAMDSPGPTTGSAFRVAQEKFFAKHLGGRYQEYGQAERSGKASTRWWCRSRRSPWMSPRAISSRRRQRRFPAVDTEQSQAGEDEIHGESGRPGSGDRRGCRRRVRRGEARRSGCLENHLRAVEPDGRRDRHVRRRREDSYACVPWSQTGRRRR